MKRKILQVFVLILFVFIFFVDESKAQSDETKIYKHEINLDVSPLLNAGLNSQGFLYRRYFGSSALRVQLDMGFSMQEDKYQRKETNALLNDQEFDVFNSSYSLRIGWQKSKAFGKVSLYAGIDGKGSLSNYTVFNHEYDENGNVVSRNDRMQNYLGVGLDPLAGISYAFSERFSLSIQASSELSVQKSLRKTDNLYTNSEERITDFTSNIINIDLLSGFGLFVGYKF